MGARLRIGYFLADPGVDLARSEGGCIHVRRIVEGLRGRGHEVRVVAVQPEEVVLTDTGDDVVKKDLDFLHLRNGPDPEFARLCLDELTAIGCEPREIEAFQHGWEGSPAWGQEIATSARAYHVGLRTLRDCDVLHVRPGPFDLGALLCARELGAPLVLEVNTAAVEEALAYYPSVFEWRTEGLARAVVRRGLEAADAIVTVSSSLRDVLVSDWGAEPGKVTVLPNAASPAGPPPGPERTAALMARHGFGRSDRLIVFLGALQPWHGVDVLIRAFASLREGHPEARLLVIGDGEERPHLVETARSLGIEEAVAMAGRLPHAEALELLQLADVAVAPYPRLPIRFYFSPLKLYEYMAAGRAIVASRQGQIAETLADGETALLVEPGDADDLARALERLLEDDALRADLGGRAREKALREHTWEEYTLRLEELYRALLAPR